MAATSKDKDKSKSKSSKEDTLCTNLNCGRHGHTNNQCWEKGGGKEGQAPEWWKKIKGNKVSANIAENKTANKDEPENYAMLAFDLPNEPMALVCTSDFHSEAHSIISTSNDVGSILDSGASRHFSPDRPKFLNYQELTNPEPIRAVDGRTFSVLGKGDLQIYLPNGNQKLTLITLKNVFYSPHMAFTLISVSCVDRAGFSLFIKGGMCIMHGPKLNIIGRIPNFVGYTVLSTLKPPIIPISPMLLPNKSLLTSSTTEWDM